MDCFIRDIGEVLMPGAWLLPCRSIHVYLFEPNPLLRKLINAKLKACANVKVLNITAEQYPFGSNQSAASRIVILDRGTLGARFRAELQATLLGSPGGRIAVLDNEMGIADLSALIRLGVHGFLNYQRLEKELCPALVRLRRGELWFSNAVMEHYIKTTIESSQSDECRNAASSLTPRQQQVMLMLRKGLSNKEIGSAIGITESTVKFHLKKIFDKLGVSDRRAILLLPENRIKSFYLHETDEQTSLVS
jgi:DNA-binding NarL/FixJ family response regulator